MSKRKAMNTTAKRKRVAPGCKAAASDSKEHWTQSIEPKSAALLSQMLGPIYFVVKNLGSNNLLLAAEHGDLMDLSPGAVRATYARGAIRVENPGEKPALIEFDFLPIYLKP
jgi:hypothetical protein